MKKLLFVTCFLALASSPSFAQTAAALTSWATQGEILSASPVDLGTEMAGGVAIGEHLYMAGGYMRDASTVTDNDLVWRWPVDQNTGALGTAVMQPKLPNTDSYAYIFEMVTGTPDAIYIAGGGWNFTGPNPDFVTYNLIGSGNDLTESPWLQSAVFPTANDKSGPGTGPYSPELGGSVICENGYLYVFGGDQENTPSGSSLDCFYAQIQSDESLGAWQTGTSTPDYWWFGGAESIGNYIICLPGIVGARSNANATDAVYVCQVNTDGTMGPWVRQAETLPQEGYDVMLVAAGNTLFGIGGRAIGGVAQSWVWRAEFNPGTGTVGAWTDTEQQLPYILRYHQASYSDWCKRIIVYSLRTDPTDNTNEAFISNALFSIGPTPTPTNTPIVAGTGKVWKDYR